MSTLEGSANDKTCRIIYTDFMTAREKAMWNTTGLGQASFDDAVKAVFKIATDTSVNGKLINPGAPL